MPVVLVFEDDGDAGRRVGVRGERGDLRSGQRGPGGCHHQRRVLTQLGGAFGQGDGFQRAAGHDGPAGPLRLLCQADEAVRRPVDRRGGAVQHRCRVGRRAGRGVPDPPDDRCAGSTVVSHPDHHAIAEPVDQLPAATGRGQATGHDLGVGKPTPTQLVDDRRRPVRGVSHRPTPVSRHALCRQPPRWPWRVVELLTVDLDGDGLGSKQPLPDSLVHWLRRGGASYLRRQGLCPTRQVIGPVHRRDDPFDRVTRRSHHRSWPAPSPSGSSPAARSASNTRW
ncbi:hypothetical protein GA0070563_12658 [Micromonospora carbonacea]|uniref:Uncharacterized protein n=1 Tax=Micromonospora carbonacea TaxID=47853 RepID=A0A1C5AY91_9ACTN|nr:hypothetical protein GA0070563_12658 [Micromonospora carbonacea]